MRFLVTSLALAAALPVVSAANAPFGWGGAGGDTQMVAPALPGPATVPAASRPSPLRGGIRPAASVTPGPTTFASGARRGAAAPALPDAQARWCLGHATTSSIP